MSISNFRKASVHARRHNLRNISCLFYSSSQLTNLSVSVRKDYRLHLHRKRRVRSAAANLAAQGSDQAYLLLIICASDLGTNPGPGKFSCGACGKSVRNE